MTRLIVFLVATLFSTGVIAAGSYSAFELTNEQIEFVEAAVAKRLKDPSSATFPEKFSAVRNNSDKDSVTVCGRVNAKNSFGAYAGATPFYISLRPPFFGQTEPFYALVTMVGGGEFEPEIVAEMCKEFGIDRF